MRHLEKKILSFISAEGLFPRTGKILLACSGGADSTALVHIITALAKRGHLPVEICCAHINHQLRGDESQRDENYVAKQCRELAVPLTIRKIGVREYAGKENLSIESAARELRMNALIEIALREKCCYIATAHQKNDNAETVVQRLSRGTGFRGLCGIWPVKQFSENIYFVRPLLCVSRSEIINYLRGAKIKWCQDSTNLECIYRRNFIRHRLLPELQKNSKTDLSQRFSELSNAARGFYRFVSATADVVWPKAANTQKAGVSLDVNVIKKSHPEVRIEIVRRVLGRMAVGEQDFTENHYKNLLKLSRDKKLQLPGNIEAHRQGGDIRFSLLVARCPDELRVTNQQSQVTSSLNIPGKTQFAGVHIEAGIFDYDSALFRAFKANKNNAVEWFDFDKLKPPLKIRHRKFGDRFRPLGLAGEKKIGKFLTTAKVPRALRQQLLVVEDAEKTIWLYPVRISESVKVTNQTKKILQLKICS